MRFKTLLISIAFLLTFSALPAFAQNTASIQGTVLDAHSASVGHAKVTVTEQSTGIDHETVASELGFYRVGNLPPGLYTVTVEMASFRKSVTKDVLVEAELPRGLDVRLEVGAVAEQVTVTASGTGLDTEDAS